LRVNWSSMGPSRSVNLGVVEWLSFGLDGAGWPRVGKHRRRGRSTQSKAGRRRRPLFRNFLRVKSLIVRPSLRLLESPCCKEPIPAWADKSRCRPGIVRDHLQFSRSRRPAGEELPGRVRAQQREAGNQGAPIQTTPQASRNRNGLFVVSVNPQCNKGRCLNLSTLRADRAAPCSKQSGRAERQCGRGHRQTRRVGMTTCGRISKESSTCPPGAPAAPDRQVLAQLSTRPFSLPFTLNAVLF